MVSFEQRQTEENERAQNLARIGGLSLDEAFGRLRLFNKPQTTPEERERAGRAFVALTALLREDPHALGRVREHLEKKGPLTVTLLAALRDASTPQSQELLAKLSAATSSLDPELRLEAARCLSRVAQPSLETVRALQQLRADRDLAQQATFGLGSALFRAKEQDPILAHELRTTLATQLESATQPRQQADVLIALGNAGDPSMLDRVVPFSTHTSEVVRAAAVQAVRRIPGSAPEPLLAQACADPSADVRFSAVDAIRERAAAPNLSQAVSDLALHESNYQVRARALNIVVQWLPTIPSLAQTLAQVSLNDENADLRNLAKTALEKPRT